MFQDLDVRYDNTFHLEQPTPDSLALIFRGDAVLAKRENDLLQLPTFAVLTGAQEKAGFRYAFTLGEQIFFLSDNMSGESPAAEGFQYIPSREYRSLGPKETVFAAAVGESLHRW